MAHRELACTCPLSYTKTNKERIKINYRPSNKTVGEKEEEKGNELLV